MITAIELPYILCTSVTYKEMEDLIFLNNSFTFRHVFRYHAVLLRARFDEHANEMDARKAKKLLLDGEHELWLKMHPQPIKCNYF